MLIRGWWNDYLCGVVFDRVHGLFFGDVFLIGVCCVARSLVVDAWFAPAGVGVGDGSAWCGGAYAAVVYSGRGLSAVYVGLGGGRAWLCHSGLYFD